MVSRSLPEMNHSSGSAYQKVGPKPNVATFQPVPADDDKGIEIQEESPPVMSLTDNASS